MKTLHLTNAWHASSGGIGTFYKALFEAADRAGNRMRLIVPGDSTRTEKVGEFGLIYHIEAPRAPLDHRYRMLYPHRFLFPKTAIQRILNAEEPDLVEISEKYTLPYLAGLLRTGRLPGVSVRPVVVGASHERMDENMAAWISDSPAAARFCRWYMKSIYFPMFDHHVTFSEHTAAELVQASRGHKVRRGIWVSPMGVDYARFRNARPPEDRGPEARSTVLYAGRLSPEKNVRLLVETMARLDPAQFTLSVAGDGPLLNELKGECAARRLQNFTFLGHLADRSALAALYRSADIFIHPNPREPFGIAPLEAMAAGLPLIAPNQGGVTSYANDNNAWLVNPDAASFACAARAIRSDPAGRAAKTQAARETAAHYDWAEVTARLLNVYRQLIAITRVPDRAPKIEPLAWSTPGNAWGREIPETNYSENVWKHS